MPSASRIEVRTGRMSTTQTMVRNAIYSTMCRRRSAETNWWKSRICIEAQQDKVGRLDGKVSSQLPNRSIRVWLWARRPLHTVVVLGGLLGLALVCANVQLRGGPEDLAPVVDQRLGNFGIVHLFDGRNFWPG